MKQTQNFEEFIGVLDRYLALSSTDGVSERKTLRASLKEIVKEYKTQIEEVKTLYKSGEMIVIPSNSTVLIIPKVMTDVIKGMAPISDLFSDEIIEERNALLERKMKEWEDWEKRNKQEKP
jgi:hypothetical protein